MKRDETATIVLDVLGYLNDVVSEAAAPGAALRRLEPVRDRHPHTPIEVVWEDQAFDGSFHYDALIRPSGERTISLSVCADTLVPWPMRGLQRARDSDLLRVNGTVLSVSSAIAQLDVLWEKVPLMQRLIDSCLIEETLRQTPVEVDADDVQAALDGMRRARGLLTPSQTQAWMKDSGMTWQALEEMATSLARMAKLRDRIIGDQVDGYFARHRDLFDTVALAIVQVSSEQAAHALAGAVGDGREALLQAAQRAFATGDFGVTQSLLRRSRRHQLAPELQQALARPGNTRALQGRPAVLGPVLLADGFALVEVLAIEPARLDDSLRSAITVKLFEDWLSQRRSEARIEWFWGRVQDTASGTVLAA